MFFEPTTILARNVNGALREGLNAVSDSRRSKVQNSRNGIVQVLNGPAVIHTANPMERVLFNPVRNANPFFHLMESLWMLAGRNDLPWLAQYNRRMAEYSDDGGKTQPAAYGFRWREYFGYDQIDAVVEELRRDPGTRRCVLGMWNPGGERDASILVGVSDLYAAINGSADVPCNTQCYFTIADMELHMAVTCRSNDLLWGAHGANAVHFSVLQEYIAAKVGVMVGTMTQFSWNYHLYDSALKRPVADYIAAHDDKYMSDEAEVTTMFTPSDAKLFDAELPVLMEHLDPANNRGDMLRRTRAAPKLTHRFLRDVAEPMARVWDFYRAADLHAARQFCHAIGAGDWQVAASEYIERAWLRHQ